MLSPDKVASLRRRSLLTAGMAGAVSLAGCGDDKPSKASTAVDKVTFVSGFGITGQDSYMYVGIEKGLYREANLEVTVMSGGGTRTNLLHLKSGAAQFAVIDVTGALLEVDRGNPADFKVFASVYQSPVACIIVHPKASITVPTDLVGKRVAYSEGGVNKTIFPAYAQLSGLDEKKVAWVAVPPPAVRTSFIAGQVDAAVEVMPGRPAIEQAVGQKITVLPYSDVVRDLYSNGLGATTGLVRANPGLVRRFRDATLEALAWTIENPDEAGAILHKHQPSYDATVAAAEIRETVIYVRGNAPTLGHIEDARMNRCVALVQSVGLIKPGLDPARVVAFDLVPGR